ncbi:MAG: four helix bundle protein [Candidatus Aminicenantaceae bacterium]
MAEYYTFENLECWRQAKDLALDVHRFSATGSLNGDEVMGEQLRQSALRVMSRIAEGKSRGSGTEFIYYLKLAKASAAALQSSLILSRDIGYLGEGDFLDLQDRTNRVSALVGGLINAIKRGQKERKEAKTDAKRAESIVGNVAADGAPAEGAPAVAEVHEDGPDGAQEPAESVPF